MEKPKQNSRVSADALPGGSPEITHTDFVIIGLTREGQKFRPSDWAERLCDVLSSFTGKGRIKYSLHAHPGLFEGNKAVFVDAKLQELQPLAYEHLMRFARENHLQIADKQPTNTKASDGH